MKQYTVREASDILGVNPRAVQKRCVRANLDMTKGVYLIPENIFKKWVAKKERTSNMTIVRPSTLEKENYVRTRQLDVPDYASISKRPKKDNSETEKLLKEIQALKETIQSHNKLFRIMNNKMKSIEEYDFKNVTEEIKENIPEPPLRVYNSVHPPNSEEIDKKSGKRFPKPSMNDVNFQSGYNPNWNKDKD